jgi:hypothetical protein
VDKRQGSDRNGQRSLIIRSTHHGSFGKRELHVLRAAALGFLPDVTTVTMTAAIPVITVSAAAVTHGHDDLRAAW